MKEDVERIGMNPEPLICEVCGKNTAVEVGAVPGVPMSAAYCKECLRAGAHPLSALIANTACCGGLKNCAEWWQYMVAATLKHLDKSLDWFNDEVSKIGEEGNEDITEKENKVRRTVPR